MSKTTTTPLLSLDPESPLRVFDPDTLVNRDRLNKEKKDAKKREEEARQYFDAREIIREALDDPTLTFPVTVQGCFPKKGDRTKEMNAILDELIKQPHPFECVLDGGHYLIRVEDETSERNRRKQYHRMWLVFLAGIVMIIAGSFIFVTLGWLSRDDIGAFNFFFSSVFFCATPWLHDIIEFNFPLTMDAIDRAL